MSSHKDSAGLNDPTLKYAELTGLIIRAAMTVHSGMGNGFQDRIYYQLALAIELAVAGIPFEREYEMPIPYKKHHIGTRRVDFLVDRSVSVELRALITLEPVHLAQAINYLEAHNLEVGLLIDFGRRACSLNESQTERPDWTSGTLQL